MLKFDEKFFEGETIDGFYVEGDMKRAWAAQMEMLMEIDRICKKYEIQYYAEYGTLLGAVRHKGFIPWDDDMDISMKRDDYQKFMQVAPGELPFGWYLLSPQLAKNWNLPFMRLINGQGIDIRREHLERFHGCPYTVGIDIFPLDYLPSDEAELEVLKILYEHTLYIKKIIEEPKEGENQEEREETIEQLLTQLESDLRFKIDRSNSVVNQLLVRLEQMSTLYREEETERLGVMCFVSVGTSKELQKKWYEEAVLLPFENIMLPAPKGYDEVLTATYGNYMIPVREKGGHDYPFYKNQRKQVEEMLEKLRKIDERLTKLEENV